MSLTPEQCTVLQDKLTDATSQYHSLVTGTAARVVVDQNGQRVEFTSANRTNLLSYISMLQGQINACCGGAASPALFQAVRPMGFLF